MSDIARMTFGFATVCAFAFIAIKNPRAFRFLVVTFIAAMFFGFIVLLFIGNSAPTDVIEVGSFSVPMEHVKGVCVWLMALLVAIADDHRRKVRQGEMAGRMDG
jgi:hypothetical protein